MPKWMIVAALAATLAGCGPSEYEKAQAKLTAAQTTREEMQKSLDVLSKSRYSELGADGQQAYNDAKKLIEQADREIMEATAKLRELSN